MSEDAFNFGPDTIVNYCQPPQAGEQALQRIRMEHQYGKGPYVGRADHDATIPDSLRFVDVFWDEWGQQYLRERLEQFGVSDPLSVVTAIDEARSSEPAPIDIKQITADIEEDTADG